MRNIGRFGAYGVSLVLLGAALSAISVSANAKEPDVPALDPDVEAADSEPAADEATPASDELPGAFSGSVALTSNYVDRGVTNSDDEPAIQGTLEYALETGVLGTSVYIGTFASNAKLEGDTDTSNIEIDALFGIRGDIGDTGLSWDLGGAFYAYPGTARRDNFDYWEIPLTLTYKVNDWLEVEFFNAATSEYQFNTGIGNYSNGEVTVTIPNPWVDWSVYGWVGYQYVEKDVSGTDWLLGTTVTIKGVDFSVAYTDTNYSRGACGNSNDCDAKVVFAVGASF